MLGNVWEWVEDCYQANYDLAPRDGSAWTKGCMGRVLRGGAWAAGPTGLRAAVRISDDTVHRINLVGFRIARTLP